MRVAFIRMGFHEDDFNQGRLSSGWLLSGGLSSGRAFSFISNGGGGEGLQNQFPLAATYCSTSYTYRSTSPTQLHG